MPKNRKTVGVPAPHTRSGNKAVWNPSMAIEVDSLVSTETTILLRKKNIPQGEKEVYTRLVVDIRPNKEVHDRLRMCM